jgi:hypothetical protein
MGLRGDRIAYHYPWSMLVTAGVNAKGNRKESRTYAFRKSVRIRADKVVKFGVVDDLFEAADFAVEVFSKMKAQSYFGTMESANQWLEQHYFNLSSLLCASRSGDVSNVQKLVDDPHFCVMCHVDMRAALHGPVKLFPGVIETVDSVSVARHMVRLDMRQTRRVFWNRDHAYDRDVWDAADNVYWHNTWIWDHPHYFSYDSARLYRHGTFYDITRIELECMFECEKIRGKLSNTLPDPLKKQSEVEIRMKHMYRFPGPPGKLKSGVGAVTWKLVVSHLFVLATGIALKDYEIGTISEFAERHEFLETFERALLRNVIYVDPVLDIRFTDYAQSNYIAYVKRTMTVFERPETGPRLAD